MSIVKQIVELLLGMLSEEKFKEVVDGLLDKVEEAVVNSDTKLDDSIVLPLCRTARKLLHVPDDDDVG